MEKITVLLPPQYAEQIITVSREDAYVKYARAAGVTVPELTDEDKAQAFADAIISAAAALMGG